jgi:L-glyceraldehyde 3-phosphate reductase
MRATVVICLQLDVGGAFIRMEYRRLGKSGVRVSEIALGSWLTYGTVTEQETAVSCVHRAYDLGINHFDCANVYGSQPHAAEEVLAKALAPFARDSYVVTTKVFGRVGDGVNDQGLSRKHIMSQIERSLKALRTDYVDILYCHRFDTQTNLEETLLALDDLVRQGKVLYTGFSEWAPHQIAEAAALQKELNLHKFAASQPVYNMFNRYIENTVVPLCSEAGIGQVVFSPLAQGVLTGKYKRGQSAPTGSRGAQDRVQRFVQGYLQDENLRKVEALMDVAKSLNITVAQLALAFVLRLPGVSSALIGASQPQQIDENAKASGVKLDESALTEIEQILAEIK